MIGARLHRGVALITVMIIIAIVAGVAASMLRDHQLNLRRATNLLHGDQTITHLLAAETWARQVLLEDLKDGEIDHLGEGWAEALLPVETDGGALAGRIRDQQGLFNLNSLIDRELKADPAAMAQFERLVAQIELEESVDPLALAEALADWQDPDEEVTGIGGAEDADYAVQDPPYRSPDRPLFSPTELLLVRGMTYELWLKLAPLVTALPPQDGQPEPLNVNTAPAAVLAAVLGADTSLADELVGERESDPFENTQQFIARLEQSLGAEAVAKLEVDRFSTASRYFLVESEAQFGDLTLSMRHLIRRESDRTTVLARALGEYW